MSNNRLCNSNWKLLSKGAEATLYVGTYMSLPAIKKVRHPKPYRHPKLDMKLRMLRTRREAKLLVLAKHVGVLTPFVFDVDLKQCTIIMEYIEGVLLRDYIHQLEMEGRTDESLSLMRKAGSLLARLHNGGIIHGDFTTSNILFSRHAGLFVIDFGLGYVYKSDDPEDYAMDLRVFSRGLEVFHYTHYNDFMNKFLEGYQDCYRYDSVVSRLREIFRRGRYIEERRIRKIFKP